jgi:Fur family transcriptional regulator, ferric uptake regulator
VTGSGTPDEQAWSSALRSRGYRLTSQRVRVLAALGELGHATPEGIAATGGVDLSTVYRTLELFEELGLVTHAHLGGGAPSYHLAAEEPHVHLVCRSCGDVAEAGPDLVAGLVERLERERGFAVDVAHIAVTGECAACRGSETDVASTV